MHAAMGIREFSKMIFNQGNIPEDSISVSHSRLALSAGEVQREDIMRLH
jgi:hypothetical protein